MTDPIRAKIIELVPELAGYEYGTDYCSRHEFRSRAAEVVDCPDCKPESREITLADVLRAIQKIAPPFHQEVIFGASEIQRLLGMFDLTADYDGQTQEVKDFIGKIIGVTD